MKNRQLLTSCKKVGCYYCNKIFDFQEIKEFTDKGQTCICPHCGIDSIVGDNQGFELTEEILKNAHKQLF